MRVLPVLPRNFDAWRWWEPKRQGIRWFYASPRRGFHRGSLRIEPETLDPEVRRLVSLCHARGYPTLPSCAGHAVREETIPPLLAALQEDEAKIREDGLLLREVESGTFRTWKDPHYRMPSPEIFTKMLHETHGHGGMGVQRIPENRIDGIIHAAKKYGFSAERIGANTLRFNLYETDAKTRTQAWYNLSLVFEDLT